MFIVWSSVYTWHVCLVSPYLGISVSFQHNKPAKQAILGCLPPAWTSVMLPRRDARFFMSLLGVHSTLKSQHDQLEMRWIFKFTKAPQAIQNLHRKIATEENHWVQVSTFSFLCLLLFFHESVAFCIVATEGDELKGPWTPATPNLSTQCLWLRKID